MEAEVLLEALPEEDCRFDHNRDCQEHAWFGIDGKCPVAQSKELISAALKAPIDTESAPRPVIDREALRTRLWEVWQNPKSAPADYADEWTDAVMGLARPMPTREQIEQSVRRIYIDGGAHITHAQEAAAEIATAVLALLNGSEK